MSNSKELMRFRRWSNSKAAAQIVPGTIIAITSPEFFDIPGAASHKAPESWQGTGRNHPWSAHFAPRKRFYKVLDIPTNNELFHAVSAYGKPRTIHALDSNIIIEIIRP